MRILKHTVLVIIAGVALLVLAVAGWIALTLRDLPDVALLKRYRPAAASEVLDRRGAVITHFTERKYRIWVPIAGVPDHVVRAVVTAEDDTFFGHSGVNYQAVWEALKHDVQKKRFARGGSTITQQMIKNVLLSREKTLSRKVREFVLARRAEEVLTKRQILEIYLNEVEWGTDLYGIEAAARYYFDKHTAELTPGEAALLAGMLPNPRYYDPFKRQEKARQRQEQVLFNLFQAKLLTQEEYAAALERQPVLRDPSSRRFDLPSAAGERERPCHLQVLEQMLAGRFGEQALYRQGLHIRTTLDRSLQNAVAALVPPAGREGRIMVVREGGEVRAVACVENEEAVRAYLAGLATPEPGYELVASSPDALAREQIVLPEGAEARPAVRFGETETAPSPAPVPAMENKQ